MPSILRENGINGDSAIDHRANNIVNDLSCLPYFYVPLAAIGDRHFQPVLV